MYRLLLLLVLSFSVQAHQNDVVWLKYAQASQGIASLEFNDYGLPKLYISMKQSYVCNPKLVFPSSHKIMKVDGVNITFKEICVSPESNHFGVSVLTPKGEVSTNYVIKHFNENKFVIIDGVYFSAIGFNTAYKKAVNITESSIKVD